MTTKKYMVRNGFFPQITVGRNVQNYSGGDFLDLSPEQYDKIKHMVEEVPLEGKKEVAK